MTREEFISQWEPEFSSILLAGFVTKEQDAGMLFRIMCLNARRLREKLGAIHDANNPNRPIQTVRKTEHERSANGKPIDKPQAQQAAPQGKPPGIR